MQRIMSFYYVSLFSCVFICVFCFCFGNTKVPPGIVGENNLEDVKVKESQSIMLKCEVTGKLKLILLVYICLACRDISVLIPI